MMISEELDGKNRRPRQMPGQRSFGPNQATTSSNLRLHLIPADKSSGAGSYPIKTKEEDDVA
jgi:hypothetical protein